jgi:hypothetical protein
MYVINLEEMKQEKIYNYETREINIPITLTEAYDMNVSKFKEMIKNAINKENLSSLTDYCFNIKLDDNLSADEEVEAIVCVSELITNTFFQTITTEEDRNREYRLDLPDNLTVLNMNRLYLKKAINYKTLIDKFQISIKFGDKFSFMLNNEQLEKIEEKEFKHSLEEL